MHQFTGACPAAEWVPNLGWTAHKKKGDPEESPSLALAVREG